jgi:uncharacterized protein YndB with AHSA1/START domain
LKKASHIAILIMPGGKERREQENRKLARCVAETSEVSKTSEISEWKGECMKAEGTIVINASPEKVWPYLVEPEKVLLWSSTYQKYEYAGDQHDGAGTRYYLEEKAGGPLMKINFEAMEWEENKALTLRMVSGEGVKAYQQTYRLEKLEQGCQLAFMEEVELPMGFIGKIIGSLAEGMSKATIKEIQLKLKALVEA